MSLGSLIQGFQQGYRFVDDIDRQNKEDQFKDEVRGRQRKEWSKEDEYEAKRKELWQQHYGQNQEAPAEVPADVNPARVAAMEKGAGVQPAAVPAPQVQAQPMPAAPAANTGAPVDMMTAGQGRGFVNPPTVTAADRSVAPGKVNLNTMSPAQKQNLLVLAEKQFGMRHGPGDGGQFVNASMPPAAQVAAAQGATPVQTKINRPDPMQDVGRTLKFAMDQAKLDVEYGKKDGQGLVTLAKTVEAMKREGMDRATALLHQGRYQEAMDLFNAQGDHTGVQVVSAQDGTFKMGKTEVPTKIVTLRKEDGTTRVINTAQDQYLMMGMEKQLEAAQKERSADITEKHYDAVLGEQRENRMDRREDSRIRREQTDRAFGLQEREYNDRQPTGPKLPEIVKTRVSALQERSKVISQIVAKAQAEGSFQADSEGAKALVAEQRTIDLQIRNMTEPYLADTKAAPKADPLGIRSVKTSDSTQPDAPKATPAAAAATKGTGTGKPAEPAKPKESWSETVAKKEATFKDASERKSKADADPELQALQQKKKDAAAKGDLTAARQFLREHDELKAKRYSL